MLLPGVAKLPCPARALSFPYVVPARAFVVAVLAIAEHRMSVMMAVLVGNWFLVAEEEEEDDDDEEEEDEEDE